MAQPTKKFRAGSISCALWENQAKMNGQTVTMLKALVERRYKTSDGEWKSSGSFGRNEIPLVIYCLKKAFETIVEERSDEPNGSVEEEMVM